MGVRDVLRKHSVIRCTSHQRRNSRVGKCLPTCSSFHFFTAPLIHPTPFHTQNIPLGYYFPPYTPSRLPRKLPLSTPTTHRHLLTSRVLCTLRRITVIQFGLVIPRYLSPSFRVNMINSHNATRGTVTIRRVED